MLSIKKHQLRITRYVRIAAPYPHSGIVREWVSLPGRVFLAGWAILVGRIGPTGRPILAERVGVA